MVYPGSNPEHSPQLVKAEAMDQLALRGTLSAFMCCAMRRWILGWVALCEIFCEMHIAHLLLILSSPNPLMWESYLQN
jgi:hypothetical protein